MSNKRFFIFIFLTFSLSYLYSQTSLPVSRTIWNGGTPSGWTDSGTGSYTTSFACTGDNMGQLNSTGDYYEVYFSGAPSTLTFTYKLAPGSGNWNGTFTVLESTNGTSFTTAFTYTDNLTGLGTNPPCNGTNVSLQTTSRYVRITFTTKTTGNVGIDDVSITGSSPDISISPSSLSGFTYIVGSGPSTSQSYTISGSGFTPISGNITVSAPADYDVSSASNFSSALTSIAYTGGALSSTTVYVRLKSGRSVGTYNGQTISHSGGGATDQTVTLNGSVTAAPTISISPTSLSGFTYISGSGPSPAQQYTISAANLSPSSGNITVSTPTDYDVSTQADFSTALTSLAYTSGTLSTTTVYVRLKAGLTVGTYNGQIINHSGGGATSQTVTLNGSSTLPIELLAFSGKAIEQSIGLFWSTATEKNNDYMAIERSVDADNFSEIGRVKGAGNSLERIDYSFVDRFPYQGTNYYRLRQVDYDGTTTYHKVIAVEFTGESVNTLGFVPTAEGIQVQFRAPGAGGELILVDATGRILRIQKFDGQSTSSQISTAALPRGFYVLQVRRADGKREAWPLVK